MSLYPSPGRETPNDHGSVFVSIVGELQEMWAPTPRGMRGVGGVMSTDDVRTMAHKLLEAADWADEQTAINHAPAQDLEGAS